MSPLDLFLLVVLALAAYSGARRGAVHQLTTYMGLGVGLLAGTMLAPHAAALASSSGTQARLAVGTLLVGGAIGHGVGWMVGVRLRTRVRSPGLGRADSFGGVVVSVTAVLLVTWFLALNLVGGPMPGVSRQIQRSVVVRGLAAALPEPPSLVGEARRFLNVLGFPDVFLGLPPNPADPVTPPTDAQAKAAFDAASQSIVKIIEPACGQILGGSGFVAAPELVVTNAHVVAGGEAPRVQGSAGTLPATTIVFDSALDIAVLRAPGLRAPPLTLSSSEAARGAGGVIMGYPSGGPLTTRKAAVRATFEATGRDIYGERRVLRKIYELQTVVEPGNSGGPFVLSNGQVAGVVFASSGIDDRTGYAIASLQVRDLVSRATALTSASDTGPCRT